MERPNRSFRRVQLNHSNALPNYLIVLDTETARESIGLSGCNFSHRLRLGVAKVARLRRGLPTGEKTIRFRTADELWKIIVDATGPRHTTWLVAHNLMFDFIVAGFPAHFAEARLMVDWPRSKRKREDNQPENVHQAGLCVIDGPPTIVACRVGETQGRLVLVDSLNWFPQKLAQLGKALGLPKGELPRSTDSDDVWFRYCERDVEILYQSFLRLVDFVRANNLGMFRYTGAAQAMSAYRHRFMAHPIYTHADPDVKRIERQSYFGGRLEVFRLGKIPGPIFNLDVSALFPSVMAENEYPKALHRSDITDAWRYVLPGIAWDRSIAETKISTTLPLYPVRTDKGVIYPVGDFSTTLAGPELGMAKSRGDIVAVRSWAEYSTKPLFKLWVDELWELRQRCIDDGNPLYEQFVKRLMNSLYGKFGQRSGAWANSNATLAGLPWQRWSEIDCVGGTRREFRSVGYQIQERMDKVEIDGTFPAVSAFVTANARLRMNDLRVTAGERNTYYQCIDGLLTNAEGFGRLTMAGQIAPGRLGALRLVETAPAITVYGHNDYEIGGRRVISGFRPAGHDPVERQDLQRKFIVSERLFVGRPTDDVLEVIGPWQRSAPFTKGTIGPDGWIEPRHLPGDQTGDDWAPAAASVSPAATVVTCSP